MVNKHFPVKYVRFNKYKHKRTKWITKGIMISIAYRDRMYKNLKSLKEMDRRLDPLKLQLKTYNRILKTSIRLAKKKYLENLFHKCRSDIKKTWSNINQIMNRSGNKTQPSKSFRVNGVNLTDPKDVADQFNRYYVNIGPNLAEKLEKLPNKSFLDYLYSPFPKSFSFQNINSETVIKTIDSLKPKGSCGIDKISNKLLKYVKYELAEPLSLIINQCFSFNIFPNLLKIAKVTPVYKKGDSDLFENYRPVSVLSSVSKVFEKVMYNQMYDHFVKSKIFFPSQYGFRKNHSTEFAVLEVVDRIIKGMDQNKLPINIYLDLSKAFDTLDHGILLHKLSYYGLSEEAVQLFRSYLSDRRQYVELSCTVSDQCSITCGVPQGSILGPLLFTIYVNDLFLATDIFHPVLYADDTTLITSIFTTVQNSEEIINYELRNVSDWLKLNKLSLNVSKTKAMVFHCQQRVVSYPELYLEGRPIEFVKHFKFLGIIMDENLKFGNHIDQVGKKVSKVAGIMNRLKHFLPTNILKTIYNALILPHFTYGLSLWGSKAGKLFILQKKAVRLITKSHYRAHTSVMFKNLRLLKINDLCVLHDYMFCFKFHNNLVPEYFITTLSDEYHHEYLTRRRGERRIPAVSHEFARNAISYRFPVCFNQMPLDIKIKMDTVSIHHFKHFIKNRFLESYSAVCNIPNCYICDISET